MQASILDATHIGLLVIKRVKVGCIRMLARQPVSLVELTNDAIVRCLGHQLGHQSWRFSCHRKKRKESLGCEPLVTRCAADWWPRRTEARISQAFLSGSFLWNPSW